MLQVNPSLMSLVSTQYRQRGETRRNEVHDVSNVDKINRSIPLSDNETKWERKLRHVFVSLVLLKKRTVVMLSGDRHFLFNCLETVFGDKIDFS